MHLQYNYNNQYYHCPAFADKIVDKIGAGDAMLAVLSCALKKEFSPNLALFFGSLAAFFFMVLPLFCM